MKYKIITLRISLVDSGIVIKIKCIDLKSKTDRNQPAALILTDF